MLFRSEIELRLNDPEATGFEIRFHDFDLEWSPIYCYDSIEFNPSDTISDFKVPV